MQTDESENHVAELEETLRQRDEKIAELRAEVAELTELVGSMREHVEDSGEMIDQWISVFDMVQDDAGVWQFDRGQADLWNKYASLLDEHRRLIRQWNKFVGEYNGKVAPRDMGRPLAASDAQQAEVLKQRKAGASLRAIAKAMNLSLRTVRTIVEKADGKDRTSKRTNELRRKEFNRLRQADFRARHGRMKSLPKDITDARKRVDVLVKAAKGLGDGRCEGVP